MIPKTNNKNVDLAITIGIIIVIIFVLNYVLKLVKNVGEIVTDPLGIPDESGGTSTGTANPNATKLTRPLNQYSNWCDQIEDIIWSTGFLPSLDTIYVSDQDELDITWIMKQQANVDDVQQMIKEYGNRGRGIIAQDYPNLVQTLRQYLSRESINAINYDYELKNINYRF
jgi:hypothetical protein